ncbi:MAG: hypothetical protein QXV17_09830 [Candidatus Micrarchaeaceae archaeon]
MEGTAETARFKGYQNKNSIVYATFITSDPCHEKHEEAREIGHNKRSKERLRRRTKICISDAKGIY